MNSEVHPAIATLVIAIAVAALGVWMWGSGVASSFGGPAELKQAPNGHTFIQIQNYLVEHDENSEYLATHDLTGLDIELFLGGFAFFSDGDILMRRGNDPRSFLDNLRAYRRDTNQSDTNPEDSISGLFRCNLNTAECERFGEEGVDFKASYSVFIDWQTDEVYISDTTRHLLRKFSPDGTELVTPVDGFKFPNQLMLHDGQLLVADTNHHEIRNLRPATSGYGEIIDRIDVVPSAARAEQQIWPSHFARVGDEWWVNNMRTGMNQGGLYVFDDDWQYNRAVELPAEADPIAILQVGQNVWVSDWNNDVVHRFSMDGEPLADLDSAGLESILAESRQERRFYNILSYTGVVLLVVVFLVLIVQALARGNDDTTQKDSSASRSMPGDDQAPLHLVPDEKVRKRMTTATWGVGILFLLAIVPLFFIFEVLDKPDTALLLAGPLALMLAIVVLITWVNKSNWGTSIKIEGDTVTLQDYTGRRSSCSIKIIRYDNTALATPDAVVMLGRPKAQIYAYEDVHEQLLPRLGNAQRIGPFAMLKLQIGLRHPQGMVVLVAALGLIAYGVYELGT